MKLLVAIGLGLLAGNAMAQDFVAPQTQQNVPVIPAPREMPPNIEGIVKEIFSVKKPWQLVNPAAPKQYGDGRNNVSYSEKDPGKPKGFIVFALDW
ncbi:MAG: hypothetical protein ACREKL_09965 [Chthoniobacterales bacterium]